MNEENAHTALIRKQHTSEDSKKEGANLRAENTKPICFVIMPFGGLFDRYYKEIYALAITEAGYEPKRADGIYSPGNIVEQIWNYTKKAKIILADMTGRNPNVLYELGLAHAISKPAILVTESLDDIPFDLRLLRHILYNKDAPNWGDCLKIDIITAIRETERDPNMAIPSAFINVTDRPEGVAITKLDKELLEIRREMAGMQAHIRNLREEGQLGLTDMVYPGGMQAHIRNLREEALSSQIKSTLENAFSERLKAKNTEK